MPQRNVAIGCMSVVRLPVSRPSYAGTDSKLMTVGAYGLQNPVGEWSRTEPRFHGDRTTQRQIS